MPEIRRREGEPQPIQEASIPQVFDERAFDELKDIVCSFDFHMRESNKDEVGERLEFLKQNRQLFGQALKHWLSADSAIRSLGMLAVYGDYDTEKDDPYDNNVVKFAIEEIERLAPEIEKSLQLPMAGVSEEEILPPYWHLATKGSDSQKKMGAYFLSRHLGVIEEEGKDPKRYFNFRRYVDSIMKYGWEGGQEKIAEMVLRVADECKGKDHLHFLISSMYESKNEKWAEKAMELIEGELTAAGLPTKELLKDWHRSTKKERLPDVVGNNLRAIRAIERKKQGSCKFLHDEFGISDFDRYPTEMLLRQIEEFDSRRNPYGLIIFPRDDHNGSFYLDKSILEDLYDQLDGEFSLRVCECETKRDIARVLIKLNKRYNPPDGIGHKISLLILGGHGEKNNINFGGYEDRSDPSRSLSASDLMGRGVKKTSQFFEDNPTIILSSCSTGTEGGIGQELSEKFKAKVLAPKKPTGLLGIYASKRRGQNNFRFNVAYTDSDSKKLYKSGEPKEK